MSLTRKHTNARMSQIVRNRDTIYLAGQVGTPGDPVAAQTEQVLAKVERLLEEAGSSKRHMLQAVIWLADMNDFQAMNSVWDAWVPEGHAPARACGEARLAHPDMKVEVIVIATADPSKPLGEGGNY